MTHDDKLHDYLWDPAGPPDRDVVAMEAQLSAVAFDPAAHPLDLTRLTAPARVIRPVWRRPRPVLAMAASLLIVSAVALYNWRWYWPEGRPWTVRTTSFDTEMRVGQPISIPSTDHAIANIGRIGTMRIGGGTGIELRSTRGTRHRLRMTEGQVHVRVWAPPLSVVIETPQGEVIDMGCEFVLSVKNGVTTAQVKSGWVQFENGIDEVLIPEGASTEMSSTRAPGVPVFDDALPDFRARVRAIEGGETASVQPLLPLARQRDVYTLLQLADRVADWDVTMAETIMRRAAELSPPPDGVTIASIIRGNRENLWRWARAQDLPPPKGGWWKNWRDALPFWLSPR